jgi:hypothetical protein
VYKDSEHDKALSIYKPRDGVGQPSKSVLVQGLNFLIFFKFRNFYFHKISSLQSITPLCGKLVGLLQGILKGKYHCTIDLLFDWFGINSMTTDKFGFYLQNRLFQTSQTGGQRYSDTSHFSIPWFITINHFSPNVIFTRQLTML